ncbi:MAG: hypothetical protein P1U56_18390 [Saprospiraceae bacterium]|nr:hypothetical protein [Saprospiraceae bacterium]
MTFKRRTIELEYQNDTFWAINQGPKVIIVHDRKYRITKIQHHITIERCVHDIWDRFGFAPLKRLGIAKGELKKKKNTTILNLEVRNNKFIEFLQLSSFIFASIGILWMMLQDFYLGLLFLIILLLSFGFVYFLFDHGLKGFHSDLKNDINYFV